MILRLTDARRIRLLSFSLKATGSPARERKVRKLLKRPKQKMKRIGSLKRKSKRLMHQTLPQKAMMMSRTKKVQRRTNHKVMKKTMS